MTAAPALAAFNRGLTAQRAGRAGDAIAAYQDALAADPNLAAAHFNLGQLLREKNDLPAAARAFAAAARLRPTATDAWVSLGVCREGIGELDVALECYREAIRLDEGQAVAHFNAGNVLRQQGDVAAAAGAFRRAAELVPEAPEVWLNLGNALRELARPTDAIEALGRALAIRPDWAEPRWNLSLAQLAAGQLREGWANYESRWARAGLPDGRGLPWPQWKGEPLAGRRILTWREQGLGDEILFATCVPDLAALGGRVTLAVDGRLVGLYRRSMPEVEVIEDGDWDPAGYDLQVPLGSLPGIVRQSVDDFTPRWNHLVPDRSQLVQWTDRLRTLPPGPRVGISWRSGLAGGERSRCYAPIEAWIPLLRTPGAVFVNLQYDECEAELAAAERAGGARIHRWSGVDLRNDLESVAGLLWHLDVVITAPTAVSSLAGAVGAETWQVDTGTDWTVFGDDRSPWLPSIRLFRRASGATEWTGLMGQIAGELRQRIGRSVPALRQGSF